MITFAIPPTKDIIRDVESAVAHLAKQSWIHETRCCSFASKMVTSMELSTVGNVTA